MKYDFWIPHSLRSQKLLKFPRFHGGKEGHGEEMPFEKVLLKQMIKTFQESHKVSRLQGQAYNTHGLKEIKKYTTNSWKIVCSLVLFPRSIFTDLRRPRKLPLASSLRTAEHQTEAQLYHIYGFYNWNWTLQFKITYWKFHYDRTRGWPVLVSTDRASCSTPADNENWLLSSISPQMPWKGWINSCPTRFYYCPCRQLQSKWLCYHQPQLSLAFRAAGGSRLGQKLRSSTRLHAKNKQNQFFNAISSCLLQKSNTAKGLLLPQAFPKAQVPSTYGTFLAQAWWCFRTEEQHTLHTVL